MNTIRDSGIWICGVKLWLMAEDSLIGEAALNEAKAHLSLILRRESLTTGYPIGFEPPRRVSFPGGSSIDVTPKPPNERIYSETQPPGMPEANQANDRLPGWLDEREVRRIKGIDLGP